MGSTSGNLLVILCDQLRRDALSCYGDPNIHTPHLDALAARGMKFNHACSTYPICVPFRFSLMTGQYAHSRMVPSIGWRMSPAERTLADEFNDAGLETLYVGKWHLYGGLYHMPGYSAYHESRKPVPRAHQGRWKHWRGFELRNRHKDTCYFVDGDPTPVQVEGYQTDILFDVAMKEMAAFKKEAMRFACVLSVEPPHPPYEAPDALEDKWKDRDITLPANFRMDDPVLREVYIANRRTYYAMLENLDDNVGRMLAFLVEQGLAQDTTVVFLSDHGELGGSHGLKAKQHPYEESVGIPLIVAGPGISPGVIDEPVATEDLYPTLLGLMHRKSTQPLHGRDASPLVRGEASSLDRSGVLLEFVSENRRKNDVDAVYSTETWRGWRSQRYKYTVLGDLYGARPWQLFDLQEDPGEMNNLIEDPANEAIARAHHQALRDRLIETLDDYALLPAWGCAGLNLYAKP